MKKIFTFLIFILLLMSTNGCLSQIALLSIKNNKETVSKNYNLHIPPPTFDCSKTNIGVNWAILGLSTASTIAGGFYLLKSKSTYSDYKAYKNEILYGATTNTFSDTDLQQFEIERNRLFVEAEKLRKRGNWLFYGGGIGVLSLHVTVSLATNRCPLRLRGWK